MSTLACAVFPEAQLELQHMKGRFLTTSTPWRAPSGALIGLSAFVAYQADGTWEN